MQQRFLQTDGPNHVVEKSCLVANVVYGLACFNVLIVWTAIKNNVAVEMGIPGIGVLGDFIGPKNECAIRNLAANVKFKNWPILFLLHRANIDFVAIRTSRGRRGTHQLRGKGGGQKEIRAEHGHGQKSITEDARKGWNGPKHHRPCCLDRQRLSSEKKRSIVIE